MQGAHLIVLIVISVQQISGYGYKYSGSGNNGNSSPNQQSGFYWNGFRAYPQETPPQQPIRFEVEPKEEEEDPQYMYELLFGHQIRDVEKYERQKGCLCNNRFRDPHCGSDYKVYDNGCYFECAQDRNPGLKLVNWGKC